MEKHKEGIIPIEYEEYDIHDQLVFTFYNVTFTKDFGNVKAGETFKFIGIDYYEGVLEIYSENGENVINTIKFKCVADDGKI
jgi:hypothetical protein